MATIYGSWKQYCRLRIDYSYTQDISACSTKVTMKLYAQKSYDCENWNLYENSAYYNMNGKGNTYATFDWTSSDYDLYLGTSTFTVKHNTSTGEGSVKLYGNWHTGLSSSNILPNDISISKTVTFPTIPRYATVTASYKAKTLNTIDIGYTVDSTIDSIQGRVNSGSWKTLSGNPVRFTGLSPGTQYSLQLQVRRKDSQLWSSSNTVSVTTYDIAKITSANDFNIGTNTSISFTNPGGATVNAWIEKQSSTALLSSKRTSISSPYTFQWSESDKNLQYAASPNSNALPIKFVLNTICNGTSYTHTINKTANVTDANPEFLEFTFADVNEKTKNLTGNDQKLIQGYSNVKTTIITENKATAQKSASMVKYRTEIGSKTNEVNYSDTGTVEMQIDKVAAGTILVKAIDSRNNVKNVTKTATMIEYTDVLIKNLQLLREGGIGTSVRINLEGTFSDIDFGQYTNTILKAEYRKKEKGGTFSDEWIDITDKFVTGTGIVQNSEESNILTDYEVGTEYVVEIKITDRLSSYTRSAEVNSGETILCLNRTKKIMGVGKIPTNTLPAGSGDFKGNVVCDELIANKVTAKQSDDSSIFDKIYPIGSIYFSINSTNPSTLFGGTWVAWGTGRVPVGINTSDTNFNTVEKTGGAATITLTSSQIPSHSHGLNSHTHSFSATTDSKGGHTHKIGADFDGGSGSARYTVHSAGTSGAGTTMPTNSSGAHTHSVSGTTGKASGNTAATGSGGSHSNLQPYITCYMWKRTK